MKKSAVTLLIIGLMCGSAFSLNLGVEFQFGNSIVVSQSDVVVGANLRLSDKFEVKPQLGLVLGDINVFLLIADGNYYLPDLGKLQNYVGAGLGLGFQKDVDAEIALNGHYGVRYPFNDVVSVFGQVGLNFTLSPEFIMNTFSSGVGLTFNILK